MSTGVDAEVGGARATGAPLHGLAVFRTLRWPRTGATRSLRLAMAPLRDLGIHLHFVAARSIPHFLSSLVQVRRLRFDFVLFNGLASITPTPPRSASRAARWPTPIQRGNIGTSLWRISQAFGKPVFVYWHETDWVLDRHRREDPASARRVDHVAAHPRTVHLTASGSGSQSIRKRYPMAQPVAIYECSTVPPPFDEPVAPGRPPLVLNIASIQERKGTDLFVETAIKVCQRHAEVEFVWLGDGRPFGRWQADIERAGLEQRILFPGYVEAAHLLLRRASVLFLSSRDDPFPLSVLEAMCLGRNVVAFNVGGAPEALGGLGHTIPPFDTDAAANTILGCLDLPPDELINHRLRQRYHEHYTPECFARRLNQVLRNQIEATRRS